MCSSDLTGGQAWTPRATGPTEVASNAMAYNPTPFQTYSTGNQLQPNLMQPTLTTQAPVQQQQAGYASPSSYYSMMKMMQDRPVQYAADGGYMSSAFPMSPLSADRGPLMAQISSPVAMNTPGVPMNTPMQYAMGGIASLAQGGYPRRTGQISGPGTEKSDSIPAMLSDGEFVMTARAVRGEIGRAHV